MTQPNLSHTLRPGIRVEQSLRPARSSDHEIFMHLRGDSGSVCLVIGCQLIAAASTKPVVLVISSHVGR
jgi:hypothetical protein